MSQQQNYDVLKKSPVAKFYYQGKSHTHPVRRTVLLIEEHPEHFTGLELREGRILRDAKEAPVKTYRRNRIARFGDYCRLRMNRRDYSKKSTESTLRRMELLDLVASGA